MRWTDVGGPFWKRSGVSTISLGGSAVAPYISAKAFAFLCSLLQSTWKSLLGSGADVEVLRMLRMETHSEHLSSASDRERHTKSGFVSICPSQSSCSSCEVSRALTFAQIDGKTSHGPHGFMPHYSSFLRSLQRPVKEVLFPSLQESITSGILDLDFRN